MKLQCKYYSYCGEEKLHRNLCNKIPTIIVPALAGDTVVRHVVNICSSLSIGSFPVYLSRSFGSLLGGETVILTGPTFKPEDEIICRFGDKEVNGLYLDAARALCVIPPVSEESLVELELELRRGNAELTGRAQFRYSEYLSFTSF